MNILELVIIVAVLNISLTPELDNQFRNLKRWADNSPDSETPSPAVEIIEVVVDGPCTCSPTQPYIPLAQQPDLVLDSPDLAIDFDPPPDELFEVPIFTMAFGALSAAHIPVECMDVDFVAKTDFKTDLLASPKRSSKGSWSPSALHGPTVAFAAASAAAAASSAPGVAAAAAALPSALPVISPLPGNIAAPAHHEAFVSVQPAISPQTTDMQSTLNSILGLFSELKVGQETLHQTMLVCDAQIQADMAVLSSAVRYEIKAISDNTDNKLSEVHQQMVDMQRKHSHEEDHRFDTLQQRMVDMQQKQTADQMALKIYVDGMQQKQTADQLALNIYVDGKATSTCNIPGIGANIQSGSSSSTLPRPSRYGFQETVLVPTRTFLRGWSPFAKDSSQRKGISEEKAIHVANALLAKIDVGLRSLVLRISVPMFRNYQVTLVFVDSAISDDILSVSRAINEIYKRKNVVFWTLRYTARWNRQIGNGLAIPPFARLSRRFVAATLSSS